MIKLYTPKLEELSFRRSMVEDEATMSYNARWGGTIDFPQERWQSWYSRWVQDTTGERFYAYLYSEEEKSFVGEVACHLDNDSGEYIVDVIVHNQYRGKGYGGQGLELLCDHCKKVGLTAVFDDIAEDNPSVHMFLRHGFTEVGRMDGCVKVKKIL